MATELPDAKMALAQEAARQATERARAVHSLADPIPQWYVAHNGSGHDERAKEVLEREGFEFYYPLRSEMKRTPKRKLTARRRNSSIPVMQRVLKPLFLRYFFVRFDLRRPDWRSVFERGGLHGMLAQSDSKYRLPAPIADVEIEALKAQEVDGAIPGDTPVSSFRYCKGEKVRILDGVFRGFNAVVDEAPDSLVADLDESATVRLLVSLLGRASVYEMSIFDIEKL